MGDVQLFGDLRGRARAETAGCWLTALAQQSLTDCLGDGGIHVTKQPTVRDSAVDTGTRDSYVRRVIQG